MCIRDRLKGLYVMNGYFGAKALPAPYYNWNAWADPLASHNVFQAEVAVHRAIPLEAVSYTHLGTRRFCR